MKWLDVFFSRLADSLVHSAPTLILLVLITVTIVYLLVDYRHARFNQVERVVSSRLFTKDGKKINALDQYIDSKESKIELELERANILLTVSEYKNLMKYGMIIGFIVGVVLCPPAFLWKTLVFFLPDGLLQSLVARFVAGAAFAFLGSNFPALIVKREIKKRRKLLSGQISDALMTIADGLKSGNVVQEAIRSVGSQLPYPMGNEFARASQEMETGLTLNQALVALKERVDIPDFSMAMNAIEIQFEVGGKLEPLLRNMVKIISERQELLREIEKTISSSKTTGIVLLSFPVAFAGAMFMMNKPAMILMVKSGIGLMLLAIALGCYLIAAFIIAGIIKNASKDI